MKKNALYYRLKRDENFTAKVLSCEEIKKKPEGLNYKGKFYCVILDQEGFYPEGGGQASDRGQIGDAVLLTAREYLTVKEDARPTALPEIPKSLSANFTGKPESTSTIQGLENLSEDSAPILHYVDRALEIGESYPCTIDWAWRFRNSQNHSGEHIISGLVHKYFGYENVGFHMNMEGDNPSMTIDFDGELSWEQLLNIEREANEILWKNLDIRIFYPEESELPSLPYRSKKELSGAVRLVEIPGADLCACCGTHVEKTGEIGSIKLLSMMRHRSGVRVEMLCGDLALFDYEKKQDAALRASQLLSVPIHKLPDAVEKQKAELQGKDYRIALLNEKYFALKAELLMNSSLSKEEGEKNQQVLCDFEDGLNSVELRKYCDYLMKNTDFSVIAVFMEKDGSVKPKEKEKHGESESDENRKIGSSDSSEILAKSTESSEYFYVIGSPSVDLREGGKAFNRLLNGRGGGQPEMLQGTVAGSEEQIRRGIQEIFSQQLMQKG